jgi:dolichyl-phosphate beta-glucosyltransferase
MEQQKRRAYHGNKRCHGHGQYLLSIIVPAYNEEERLHDTLNKIAFFIECQEYATEVVIVNNASTDRTSSIIDDFTTQHPSFRQIYEPRRGKGAAVRTGILAGQGDYLLICDADLAVPLEEINKFLPLEQQLIDYDIAIGSREVPGSVRYGEPLFRHLMGKVFNLVVRWLVLPGFHDTQCGFKCFRRNIAHALFSISTIDGWGFDVEILYIALRRGYRIVEIPVQWHYRKKSKINPLIDPWCMLRDILKVRRNCSKGIYL